MIHVFDDFTTDVILSNTFTLSNEMVLDFRNNGLEVGGDG